MRGLLRKLSTPLESGLAAMESGWLAHGKGSQCGQAGSPLVSYGRDVVHSSLYLPEPVYEALRETAFKERCKIHDLVMEGIGLALRKRGYPAIDALKARRKR
jgi:hypothetical protein